MGEDTIAVDVDVREPTETLDAVEAHDSADPTLEELDSADLATGVKGEGRYGFERKTPSDFASSMMDSDDRLRDQVERMTQQYEMAYVLIEGSFDDFRSLTHTRVPAKALRGFAASITARNGVPVIPVSDLDTLVDMAVRISMKHMDVGSDGLRVETSVEKGAPTAMRMFGAIGGVGSETAKSLHDMFPTIEAAVQADQQEFTAIPGVGEKTAEGIHEALHEAEDAGEFAKNSEEGITVTDIA